VFGSSPQYGSGAVSKERSKVDVALFADTAKASSGAGRTFSRGETQVAGEMPAGTESLDVSDESNESGGGQDTETGYGKQSLDGGALFSKEAQLLLSTLDERLETYDLITGLLQGIPQSHGDFRISIFEQRADAWDDLFGPERNKNTELA